jgi:hypothetical protein
METRLEKQKKEDAIDILNSHFQLKSDSNLELAPSGMGSNVITCNSQSQNIASVSLYSKPYRTVFYQYLIDEGLKDKSLRKKFNQEWQTMDEIAQKTKLRNAELFFDSHIL